MSEIAEVIDQIFEISYVMPANRRKVSVWYRRGDKVWFNRELTPWDKLPFVSIDWSGDMPWDRQ